jgi:ankyrin repeat protein
MLLDAGGDPNYRSPDDLTALMCAAGKPQNADALLKAGADPTVTNNSGETAEGLNCDWGSPERAQVCSLIREALRRKVSTTINPPHRHN